MTESEWLTCTDPTPMLVFFRGKVSDRKIRLFAVGCCRRIWHLLHDERSRRAVDVVDQYADGEATVEELAAAYFQANVACNATDPTDLSLLRAAEVATNIAYAMVSHAAACTCIAADAVADSVADASTNARAYRAAKQGELAAQCQMLLDIVGKPFCSIAVEPTWLTPTVVEYAHAMYDQGRFVDMPILGDALEEAGCTDASILEHCRAATPHVRGCWAVDLILGKE